MWVTMSQRARVWWGSGSGSDSIPNPKFEFGSFRARAQKPDSVLFRGHRGRVGDFRVGLARVRRARQVAAQRRVVGLETELIG